MKTKRSKTILLLSVENRWSNWNKVIWQVGNDVYEGMRLTVMETKNEHPGSEPEPLG